MSKKDKKCQCENKEELNEDYIIPKAFDPRVGKAVAAAVAAGVLNVTVASEFLELLFVTLSSLLSSVVAALFSAVAL